MDVNLSATNFERFFPDFRGDEAEKNKYKT